MINFYAGNRRAFPPKSPAKNNATAQTNLFVGTEFE